MPGSCPIEILKPKQTALKSELTLFCQNYYEIEVKNLMKFRSGEGIACTGEDILILEKSSIYDFLVGELLLREKKILVKE